MTQRAAKGPGLEFLEYLTPRDGRPMPSDVRANDLMHWQTTLVTHDIASVATDCGPGRSLSCRRALSLWPTVNWDSRLGCWCAILMGTPCS